MNFAAGPMVDTWPLLAALWRFKDRLLEGKEDAIILRGPDDGLDDPKADEPFLRDKEWKAVGNTIERVRRVLQIANPTITLGATGVCAIGRLRGGKQPEWRAGVGEYDKQHLRHILPFRCSEGTLFICGGEVWIPVVGRLFWMNHLLPHTMQNAGTETHLHLIVDIRRNAG